jgi:hypothetical protein
MDENTNISVTEHNRILQELKRAHGITITYLWILYIAIAILIEIRNDRWVNAFQEMQEACSSSPVTFTPLKDD